jgi:hypothetical protein
MFTLHRDERRRYYLSRSSGTSSHLIEHEGEQHEPDPGSDDATQAGDALGGRPNQRNPIREVRVPIAAPEPLTKTPKTRSSTRFHQQVDALGHSKCRRVSTEVMDVLAHQSHLRLELLAGGGPCPEEAIATFDRSPQRLRMVMASIIAS